MGSGVRLATALRMSDALAPDTLKYASAKSIVRGAVAA